MFTSGVYENSRLLKLLIVRRFLDVIGLRSKKNQNGSIDLNSDARHIAIIFDKKLDVFERPKPNADNPLLPIAEPVVKTAPMARDAFLELRGICEQRVGLAVCNKGYLIP